MADKFCKKTISLCNLIIVYFEAFFYKGRKFYSPQTLIFRALVQYTGIVIFKKLDHYL